MTEDMNPNLVIGMAIVQRCRQEGREAKAAGKTASACPYGADKDLERAGWLDGWSRAPVAS